MAASRSQVVFPWVAGLCLAGLGLTLAPREVTHRWSVAVEDALLPGQQAASYVLTGLSHAVRLISPGQREQGALQETLADSQRQNRILARQLSLAQSRLAQQGSANGPLRGTSSEPLLTPSLIEARILGEETSALWRGRKLLSAGSAQQVVESALVLEGEGPLVDLGDPARLSAGDAVYAGRVVVGKIAEVGRYSSRLQRVTDEGYSGRARLARKTSRGLEYVSEGTLTGDGSALCRLRHIVDPVNVGDEVYTGGTDGVLPQPMYYGRVVRADLEPGSTEWSVWVEPEALKSNLETVQILRIAVNPGRILAN